MPNTEQTWFHLLPEISQVLICDLQEQIVARSKTNPPDSLSQSATVLCQIAQLFKLPLSFSVVPENEQKPKLIASLEPFATGENQFFRSTATHLSTPRPDTALSQSGGRL